MESKAFLFFLYTLKLDGEESCLIGGF